MLILVIWAKIVISFKSAHIRPILALTAWTITALFVVDGAATTHSRGRV